MLDIPEHHKKQQHESPHSYLVEIVIPSRDVIKPACVFRALVFIKVFRTSPRVVCFLLYTKEISAHIRIKQVFRDSTKKTDFRKY